MQRVANMSPGTLLGAVLGAAYCGAAVWAAVAAAGEDCVVAAFGAFHVIVH